tara:strand:- start:6329 stop:6535 length:207 start_codon:yes stop_codon:yes gene_type:complete
MMSRLFFFTKQTRAKTPAASKVARGSLFTLKRIFSFRTFLSQRRKKEESAEKQSGKRGNLDRRRHSDF